MLDFHLLFSLGELQSRGFVSIFRTLGEVDHISDNRTLRYLFLISHPFSADAQAAFLKLFY